MGLGKATAPCGTCAQPCATPQLAYDSNPLTGGDTVYLNAGRYLGTSANPVLEMINGAKSGSPGAQLTVTGPLDAEGHALCGTNAKPLALLDGNGLALAGVSIQVPYLTLSGLGLTGFACSGSDPFGSSVRIVNPTMTGLVLTGLESYHPTAVNCHSASDVDIDIDFNGTACAGCEISRNRFYASPEYGPAIFIMGLQGMVIRDNELFGHAMNPAFDASAIRLYGAPDTRIENNVISGNGGSAIALGDCAIPAQCGTTPSSNVQIVNNTLRMNQQATTSALSAEILLEGTLTNAVLRNNIIAADKLACVRLDPAAWLGPSSYNGYYRSGSFALVIDGATTYSTLQAWHAFGFESDSIEADPLFVSATDWHLQSTAGHWVGDGGFVADTVDSPFLDRGDPVSPFALEPGPSGGRVNLGAEGNTPAASRSPVELTVVSGDNQTAPAGSALPLPLRVQLRYAGAAVVVPNVGLQFTVGSGGGSVPGGIQQTDVNGEVAVTATLGSPGVNAFTAQLAQTAGGPSVTFTAQATVVDAGTFDAGGTDGGLDADAPRFVTGWSSSVASRRASRAAACCQQYLTPTARRRSAASCSPRPTSTARLGRSKTWRGWCSNCPAWRQTPTC
jgi:parallel beta-helix repeat protein